GNHRVMGTMDARHLIVPCPRFPDVPKQKHQWRLQIPPPGGRESIATERIMKQMKNEFFSQLDFGDKDICLNCIKRNQIK
ncbi:hypothetical protein CR513_63072, partial [Mucuna pruriens]